MKTEIKFIQGINREITFYIGQQQNENFKVIDLGKENDLWFHANGISSCHVVAEIPSDINSKDLKYIIKTGALLCKQFTNKIKTLKNVEFVYTNIKNIVKLSVPGSVSISNEKYIKI